MDGLRKTITFRKYDVKSISGAETRRDAGLGKNDAGLRTDFVQRLAVLTLGCVAVSEMLHRKNQYIPAPSGARVNVLSQACLRLSKLFRNVPGLCYLEMSSGSDHVHNAVSLCLVAGWRNLGAKRRGFATRSGIVRAPAPLGSDCLRRGCLAAGASRCWSWGSAGSTANFWLICFQYRCRKNRLAADKS